MTSSAFKPYFKLSNIVKKQSLIHLFTTGRKRLFCTEKQWKYVICKRIRSGLTNSVTAARSFCSSNSRKNVNRLDSSFCLEKDCLLIKNSNGKEAKFHFIWLRDHCQCSECYHPVTNQRQIDTFKIPLSIYPKSVSLENGILDIVWPDGHVTNYHLSWLEDHQYGQPYECFDIRSIEKVLWNSKEAINFPEDSVFSEVLDDDAKLLDYLEKIVKYGIAFVKEVPEPYNENLRRLGNRTGLIHNTFYGDVWSWTSGTVDFADTAFLQVKLDCHNDGTYFYESPGLQLLHCDSHDGKGGENVFVDGFNVAQQLQTLHPKAFNFLAKTRIPSIFLEKNKFLFKAYDPVINLDPSTKEIYQIRFNSSDRDILSCLSFEDVSMFYESSHNLTALIRDSSNELVVQPRPGRAAIFDNWRVFHGREIFTGTRSMTGFYVRRGDFLSNIHSLRSKFFT